MASGRVPRTAMILQGFANSVHSTGMGKLDQQADLSIAACREAHAQAGKMLVFIISHQQPMLSVIILPCGLFVNRELEGVPYHSARWPDR